MISENLNTHRGSEPMVGLRASLWRSAFESSVVVGIRTLAGFGDRRGLMMHSLSIVRGPRKRLGFRRLQWMAPRSSAAGGGSRLRNQSGGGPPHCKTFGVWARVHRRGASWSAVPLHRFGLC